MLDCNDFSCFVKHQNCSQIYSELELKVWAKDCCREYKLKGIIQVIGGRRRCLQFFDVLSDTYSLYVIKKNLSVCLCNYLSKETRELNLCVMQHVCVLCYLRPTFRQTSVSLVQTATNYFVCVAEWLRLSLPISNTWPSAFSLLTEDIIFQDFIFLLQLQLFVFIEQWFVTIKYWKRKFCTFSDVQNWAYVVFHFIYQTSFVNQ